MEDTVIKVDSVSKRYRLGLQEKSSDTLAGTLANLVKAPWRNFNRLRSMSRFRKDDESVFWALRDVNFEVKQGEVLGIIGRNGAGKSTLLKILSQITEPSSGKIEISGRVASLLEVGTGFHPELTGRENIYMNGTILGMTKKEIDRKLDEIIDFSGVEKFIDTPVKFYSSGMKVRLGFSVAAHLEPEILIIDEVLAVGDYEFQAKCLGKMEAVAGQGRTVLFVSHNMDAVESLCSRVILLQNGSLKSDGVVKEVISMYIKQQTHLSEVFTKNIKIEDFQVGFIQDGKKQVGSNVPFACPIDFQFKVSFTDFGMSNKVYFTLTIKNSQGQIVTSLDNLYRDEPIRIGRNSCLKINCNLLQNYLVPSEYTVELWIGTFFDTFLEPAVVCTFQIVFSDYFGSSKLHNAKQHGHIILPSTWISEVISD